MAVPLLQTKLFIPPARPELVLRPRLIERLNKGLGQNHGFAHKLTLLSAPAGFGKTTLLSEWIHTVGAVRRRYPAGCEPPLHHGPILDPPVQVAWLSLDESDNDPVRFLTYLIAALQGVEARQESDGSISQGLLSALQSGQPPPAEAILTALINQLTASPGRLLLVLDDYHLIEAQPIHDALTFLLRHLPPQIHLVIATREDPLLPLARLRARGQLTELRAADLRFTSSEAAEFLNQVMGLDLSADHVAALETRTEGWIAGLQLAAVSMQGCKDAAGFVRSFTGSHHFVLDYLVEEVFQQQPESVQAFLLLTSILDRLTGPLCDALTGRDDGHATLHALEHANLFIVPLDNEQRWYRYHHLFADLLRQRLLSSPPSGGTEGGNIAELHLRASKWYEDNGLEIEAFRHAAVANDVERAERLIEGEGVPLYFRGAATPVLNWLRSLPAAVLDGTPSLWVTYASTLLVTGQTTCVEEKLQAAEAALRADEQNAKARDLIGRIASTRANLAVGHRQLETIIAQSRRALAYLHPDNMAYRTAVTWKLGVAHEFQGDRAAARQAFSEAISISQSSGDVYTHILATTGLGGIQLAENQLYQANETYHRVLQLVGDLPIPVGCHVHLRLARISYEWNDLDAARRHGQQSAQLARPYQEHYDILVACQVFLARLELANGDAASAAALLAEADRSVRRYDYVHQASEVAAAKVLTLLHQGKLQAASDLAEKSGLPSSQARVHLARGDTRAALAALERLRQQTEAKDLPDQRLKVMVLQAVALHMDGQEDQAVHLLSDALALAEPGGFIRTFVDEGPPMARLLYEAIMQGTASGYARRLLEAFPIAEAEPSASSGVHRPSSALVEPLSERELEVLGLIAQGLTNREIASRLFLSLNTVKAHTRNIYGKLDVHSRTQAVATARVLGLIPST